MADYRVGVNQFLILGALIQAPGSELSAAQLSRHLNSHKRYLSLPPILNGLIKRGCILPLDDVDKYAITKYGREARCMRSRKLQDAFLLLDRNRIEIEMYGA
jgi:hypothetical protein